MLDIKDMRLQVVRPLLHRSQLWSRASENLIIGTGLVESEFKYLQQKGGPALSFWQIEPPTITWLIAKLSTKRELMLRICNVLGYATLPQDVNQVINNMGWAMLLARLKYWFNPTPLPQADDIPAMARYWAKIYNSKNQLTDIKRFIDMYDAYGQHNID